jgi:NADPH-dependent 2,4-dienoyl-CoA reductase/sulfur reductase-like enzyme/predicted acylesterase/phospholipase RssA
MATHADYLLIGGGLACATAAETLREEGAEGSVLMVAAEKNLPYQRPPLSTQFLLGTQSEERLLILSEDFYRERAVDLRLGTRAVTVDPETQIVQTDLAGEIHYGKLLIATGAIPRRLEIPGSSLSGICYLRTLVDARNIRRAADTAKHAVVVGGSFIGMELAASLTEMGLQVTLVAMEDRLLTNLESPLISEFLGRYYAEHNIEIILSDSVIEFRGKHEVEEVITQSGRILPCDMVAVGIGVTPEIGFLRESGIAIDDGVIVDHFLQTDRPHIFAAGDVANFFDPIFNLRRRVEHWDNAVKQGRLAAKNMLGQRIAYDEVSYFFCDVFDLSFEFFGLPELADERVGRGSLQERSFAQFYLKDDVPRALFSLGRPAAETKATEALIRYRVNLHEIKAQLFDPGFLIERIPNQTVLILQGGGALGAFECGVVRALEEGKIYPDIVAGVSVGAFNGAIIASDPRNAAAALQSFWSELEVPTLDVPNEDWRRILSSWNSLIFGSPKFFHPLWFAPVFGLGQLPFRWTSFYNPSPVKDLLAKYVDFGRLKSSPVRLLISAVNVETAQVEIFDSYIDDLTPDHILASGSLPPGFPWTTINGNHYWDGGIVSNSPLEQVVDRCGAAGKRVFIVDLFPSRKRLPTNLMEVMVRRDEIVYSERVRNDVRTRDLVREFRKLVEEILGDVTFDKLVQIKNKPRYIQLMGDVSSMTITRIIREAIENEELSKDYDFSHDSIRQHKQQGYDTARKALGLGQVHRTGSGQ